MRFLKRRASAYLLNSRYSTSSGQPGWMRAADNAASHRYQAADCLSAPGPGTIPWNLALLIPKPSLWDQ